MDSSARKFTPFGIRDILSDTFESASKSFWESSCCRQNCDELTELPSGCIQSRKTYSADFKGKYFSIKYIYNNTCEGRNDCFESTYCEH